MKKNILILLFLFAIFFINGETKIAIIRSCKGNIKIIQDKEEIIAKNYFIFSKTSTVIMGEDSYLTLFFTNGDMITLNRINKFELSEKEGLKPLIEETKRYIIGINKVYTKKDTLSSRGNGTIPKEVEIEINEIEKNVSDPVLKALLKGECYKRNNLPIAAAIEFNEHKKLLEKEKK